MGDGDRLAIVLEGYGACGFWHAGNTGGEGECDGDGLTGFYNGGTAFEPDASAPLVEQEHESRAVVIGDHQVRGTVVVEVAGSNPVGIGSGTDGNRGSEGSVSLAGEKENVVGHIEIVEVSVYGDDVFNPGAAQVDFGKVGDRSGSRIGDGGFESAVAAAAENGDLLLAANSQIDFAVTVEVAGSDGFGIGSGGVFDSGSEGSVALAEKNADVVAVVI